MKCRILRSLSELEWVRKLILQDQGRINDKPDSYGRKEKPRPPRLRRESRAGRDRALPDWAATQPGRLVSGNHRETQRAHLQVGKLPGERTRRSHRARAWRPQTRPAPIPFPLYLSSRSVSRHLAFASPEPASPATKNEEAADHQCVESHTHLVAHRGSGTVRVGQGAVCHTRLPVQVQG